MPNCNWFIKNITISGMIVNFYIGIAGYSWSIVLKDSNGVVEAQTSGSSYGDHSLTAKTTGAHTLELTCNWNTSNPCEVCPVDVPPPVCTPNWQCEQPLNGYEKDGCGNRRVNTICNPTGGCIPNWQCEQPLNGYEKDGCGNRRTNPDCKPGVGAVPIIGIGLIGAGLLGVVVIASRRRKRRGKSRV